MSPSICHILCALIQNESICSRPPRGAELDKLVDTAIALDGLVKERLRERFALSVKHASEPAGDPDTPVAADAATDAPVDETGEAETATDETAETEETATDETAATPAE